eukprot:588701-Pleurochrysis_carterae.AAC.1
MSAAKVDLCCFCFAIRLQLTRRHTVGATCQARKYQAAESRPQDLKAELKSKEAKIVGLQARLIAAVHDKAMA